MKVRKGDIDEIVDANGDLIDLENIPPNGSNLETQANNTTDYNVKVGHQPFRYDMLGRFGFTLLPFFEGVEDSKPDDLLDELARYMWKRYMEIIEHYYRNPQKLKNDFRKKSKLSFEEDESNEIDYETAEKILEIVKKHMGESLKQLDENMKEGLGESAFIEGKMLDKKEKRGVVSKKDDKEVLDKKVKKIADLINKMDKDDVKKIKNLLETE
jgi:hypothetical protein